MTRFGIKELILIALFSAVLVFLYGRSHQTSNEKLYQVTSTIHQVASLDAALERDVLRMNVGLLHHYDSIASAAKELERLTEQMGELSAVSELAKPYLHLKTALDEQSMVLDNFKRNNALFRNSLRYFPIAIRQTFVDRPDLQPYLTHLHNDLLQSIALPESAVLTHLSKYVAELEEEHLPALAKHLRVMIDQRSKTQADVEAFLNCGTDEAASGLLRAYERYHDVKMASSERYRIALFLFSGLLLFYIVFIMYRLQSTATELGEANQELKFQKLALDEHAIVAVTDHRGDITYANNRFCELSEYSQEELLGQNHRLLKSGYHSDEFYKNLWQTISSGEVFHGEIKNRKKNGGYYWVDATIVPFLNEEGKPYKYVAVRSDITARKETEEIQKQLTAAFYHAAEALMISTKDGKIEHVNPAFEEMTGYSSVEVQGAPVEMLRSAEDGSRFYADINAVLERGEVWKGEARLLCKDRSEKVTLRSIAPVLDDQGDVANHITFMTDVTEEKLLRRKVEHTQRLESLGVMAGGIAHDFNNILTSILGNAKLAESKITGGKREESPYLARITKASERAADLCRQMLAYSGQGNLEMRPINLSELVHEITNLLQVSVGQSIKLHYHLGKQVPAIEADTGQLQQVIMNLITNAAESYTDGGEVDVEVARMSVDRDWLDAAVFSDEAGEGEYVYIQVKDHGCGMDKDVLDHIFEPFFTTKFTGRGLGMSAMMGIVKAHRGAISIHTERDKGTLVKVAFPAITAEPQPLSDSPGVRKSATDSHLIMVVDDEPDILELTTAILIDMGHQVLVAASGEEALEIFRNQSNKINAVITDATMPGMSGEELCKQIRALDSGVKLILSSGYDADRATQGLQAGVLNGFIQKPYSPDSFAHEVTTILGGSGNS